MHKKKKVASNFYIKYNKTLEPVNIETFRVKDTDKGLDEFGFNILDVVNYDEK